MKQHQKKRVPSCIYNMATTDRYLSGKTCLFHVPYVSGSLNICKHKFTHLVNAFFLVNHPSAHRTERAALPFSTLQWSQTLETLSYTAALSRGAREGGGWAGEERVGRDGSGGGERNRGGRGEAELLSAASALLMLSSSSIFLILLPWLLPFVFLLLRGVTHRPYVFSERRVCWVIDDTARWAGCRPNRPGSEHNLTNEKATPNKTVPGAGQKRQTDLSNTQMVCISLLDSKQKSSESFNSTFCVCLVSQGNLRIRESSAMSRKRRTGCTFPHVEKGKRTHGAASQCSTGLIKQRNMFESSIISIRGLNIRYPSTLPHFSKEMYTIIMYCILYI